MECVTFGFGKYRGLPACDVPIDYLIWAADTHGQPHKCVVDELRRRASRHGTREALAAASALSSLAFNMARVRRKKARKGGSRPKCRAVRARLPVLVSVGERFAAERAMWLASGGDLSAPPWEG